MALARARQGRAADAEQIRAGLEGRSWNTIRSLLCGLMARKPVADMDAAYKLLGQAIDERDLSQRSLSRLGAPT